MTLRSCQERKYSRIEYLDERQSGSCFKSSQEIFPPDSHRLPHQWRQGNYQLNETVNWKLETNLIAILGNDFHAKAGAIRDLDKEVRGRRMFHKFPFG